LLGISYEHDGSMEPGSIPGDDECADTLTCPAPMYFQNGEYVGVYSNNENIAPIKGDDDFGLDAVEDFFKYPLGNWEDLGPFKVALNFDVAYDQDIFYYCHMHEGMTGRIKLLDADGIMLNEEDTPEIPYEYDVVDTEFDKTCGTFNTTAWQLPNDQCVKNFVCDSEQSSSIFKTCVDAMDCHMMASMTTNAGEGGIQALFCRQMIPHHQNAVNMAKSLLKHGKLEWSCERDDRGEKPVGCRLLPILYDIINGQNRQIQKMQKVLKQLEVEEFSDCKVSYDAPSEDGRFRRITEKLETPNRHLTSVNKKGIACTPCADTTGDCEIKVKVNFFASETGYFEIHGCEGVSPTLHLTVGRTYYFDQSDINNWYHLLGISYEHDGSMEPGSIPGDDECADTLTCPAPMYFQNGEYVGVYSNNENIAPIKGDDDFGLDAVEDFFKYPLGNWEDLGPFKVALNFDVAYDQDIFYYCHMHEGMTGRIKLLDADGIMLNEEDTPTIPYEYDHVSSYDETCGTFGLQDFQLPNNQCPKTFVCNIDNTQSTDVMTMSTFAGCVNSMDCAMLDGMTTNYGGQNFKYGGSSDIALFLYQMIPHHRNAVNMAKALLKSGKANCVPPVGDEDKSVECRLEPIVRSIINVQNRQIQKMADQLYNTGATPTSTCDVSRKDTSPISGDGKRGRLKDISENLCIELAGRSLKWEICDEKKQSQVWRFEYKENGKHFGNLSSGHDESKCVKAPTHYNTHQRLKVYDCRDKRKQKWEYAGDEVYTANKDGRYMYGKHGKIKEGADVVLVKSPVSLDFFTS